MTVWVLLIFLSGKGYVGNVENIATKEECERVQKILLEKHRVYGDSICVQVKKAANGIMSLQDGRGKA